jgi:hypothetical protein
MLNEKYFKKILKLIAKYESCLDGYRVRMSKDQADIKLSYKDYKESNWIVECGNIQSVYASIQQELAVKYPQ